jgi:hypothetical protein
MSNRRTPPKQVGRDSFQALRDIYLDLFGRTKKQPDGGQAEVWLHVVKEYLTQQCWDLIPYHIVEQEERIVEMGLSQEYVAELIDLCELSPDLDEYSKLVMLLHAGPEVRKKALANIKFGGLNERMLKQTR